MKDAISNAIIETVVEAIAENKPKSLNKIVSWCSNECRIEIRERNEAFGVLRRTHSSQSFSEYKRVVRQTIRRARKEYWRKFCDSVGRRTSVARVWGMIIRGRGNNMDMSRGTKCHY